MKLQNLILATIALMPVAPAAFAHDITEDTMKVSYALGNVAEDAQEVAVALADADGVEGTYAAFYVNELIEDNKYLILHAHELSLLLDADKHDDQVVADKFEQVSLYYKRVKDGSEKAVSYLYPLKKTAEAYRLKAAFNKIGTRYVYLQNNL